MDGSTSSLDGRLKPFWEDDMDDTVNKAAHAESGGLAPLPFGGGGGSGSGGGDPCPGSGWTGQPL
eukprot:4288183-Prymnesium_polylepis.1